MNLEAGARAGHIRRRMAQDLDSLGGVGGDQYPQGMGRAYFGQQRPGKIRFPGRCGLNPEIETAGRPAAQTPLGVALGQARVLTQGRDGQAPGEFVEPKRAFEKQYRRLAERDASGGER